ncbi:serine hydrolase-like protein 2 isoform X1 [Ostrinia furnacalis]|uniref:serine hydrolase-like protein 2 isoform X1 n=1 Tax=Ostrinia furnacalis TaxID=93504 RepID=UPI00103E8807|nr:serine hydrolase-like protein 2 isoform X1 [Ostrinia furnacalis]
MLEEKQFSVEAPWGMIRGVTWGNPAHPPVLLVPGKMHVCTGYGPLVKLLPQCFYFVAIDLPGNGMSDPLPRGISLTIFDMLPAIQVVKRKLGWDHFIYMGHSLGALIGKMYDLVHPGDISRMVELDPTPAHHNWDTTREDLRRWHRTYYGSYEENKYCKFHGSLETAPKYTYEKARQMLLKHADMTEEACEQVLKRSLVPAGNGLFR